MSSTPKWQLYRTLKRRPKFHPLEVEDVKYLWAAYKKGAFDGLIKDGMQADEFENFVLADLVVRFHNIWTLTGKTRHGEIPIGIILGFWPHPSDVVPFMILDSMKWFPWSSHRNRIEGVVGFLNEARKEIPMLGFVNPKDKDFFTMIAKHGIIRRVGTTHNLFNGEPAAIFETRKANG